MTTYNTNNNDKTTSDVAMEGTLPKETESSREDGKDENAESASDGSSEGKSGSGGGYSADCSASDQSSDENGERKQSEMDLSLSVAGLKVHDRSSSPSSNSSNDGKQSSNYKSSGKRSERNARSSKDKEAGHSHVSSQSFGIGLPLKSPDVIDLDSIMRTKTEQERENAVALKDQSSLPQWNGVRVAHPMDPRIDLNSVTVLQAGIIPGNDLSLMSKPISQGASAREESSAAFSISSYSQLMEVIRPFFQSHGVSWARPMNANDVNNQADDASDHFDSSEGFTSFFTTTQSGTTNSGGTSNGGSPQSSDLDKKPRAVDHTKNDKDTENIDNSSMVVLARVKRKHKKAEDSGNSSSSGDKRVRIQDRRGNKFERGDEGDGNEASSGSSSHSQIQPPGAPEQAQAPLHIDLPPRVVTDVSSKLSSATNSNINTSTSGSGSGGNTGSGSNQGSSGSGNEEKASSEEPAHGDNSGESPVDDSFSAQLSEAVPKHSETNREQKLLDKKRKRIEMRREYEMQQQAESSESTDPLIAVVRPGKPVTMDQVLRFSKIAR
jgi:hypothetical protein